MAGLAKRYAGWRVKRILERTVLALYSWVMWASQPLLRAKLRKRGQMEPLYAYAVDERFGRYTDEAPGSLQKGLGPVVWVHAVSLGETVAAGVLISALRQRITGMQLVLTHGTATGREAGGKLLQPGDVQVWLPWDTREATHNFLKRWRPALGLLMETEVWPNLVDVCGQNNVPLCLVNARMSEKSWKQATRLALLSRPAYRNLHGVWAQTQEDTDRLKGLGASVQAVTGNLKFDATPDGQLVERGRHWRALVNKPVVMLASSREGEELMWLDAVQGLREMTESVQWLIVPRHPQRFDEVASLLIARGWGVSRRSHWNHQPEQTLPQQVWLGDSLGEMALYFAMSDAALLGGSFAPLGGQNLIEAAACACPVVMGPHTFNFSQAAESSLQAGASLRVASMQEGIEAAVELALNTNRQKTASHVAIQWSASHRGAVQRTVELIAAELLR